MNHSFTMPIGFVGGVCIFWDSSKVLLVPHKFEQLYIAFVVKVNLSRAHFNINVQTVSTFFASTNAYFTSYID